MSHTYRAAQPFDTSDCVTILRDWAEACDWMPELDERQPMEAFWQRIFEEDLAWVAQSDDQIVGFCVRNRGDENNIGALYVTAKARNHGVGKHLLDLAKQDCNHITVWAYEKNTNARKFYRREGLKEVAREFDDEIGLMDIKHHWAHAQH